MKKIDENCFVRYIKILRFVKYILAEHFSADESPGPRVTFHVPTFSLRVMHWVLFTSRNFTLLSNYDERKLQRDV